MATQPITIMRTLLLIMLFMVGLVPPLAAQTDDEKAVAQAVETLRRAMEDADKDVLEKIAATELSYGHSSGRIEDKATFINSIVSGKSDFVSIVLTDQTISIAGTTAIVRHKLSADTNDSGKPGTVKLGVMLIWQKQKDGWKLLARQAYKI